MSAALQLECQEDAASCDCFWHQNLARALETHELTVEEVMDAVDAWQAADTTREYKVRKTGIGNTCTLFERGVAIVTARGQGGANAIAHALEEIGAA